MTTTPFAFLCDEPAIEPLATLMGRGWELQPQLDGEGNLERFTGAFTWTDDGYVDALRVKSKTDAAAIRVDHAGGKVREHDGDALTILHQLIELPAPSSPLAPRLVLGSAPQLWTP
ncbi:hypothetical protein [Amycolatopsis sp. NPDC051371]|uniref:hypothetical protein n=1 Tax=Amycolatopsis sp. NPDC051371 TaxID=3155800 RepID=UPI00341D9B67